MITRAIVEELISPYEVRVRIPLLNGVPSSTISTSKEDLNIATICALPNCLMNLQVGDIVFVGFEDNTYYKAVILGCLLKESVTTSYSDIELNKLVVNGITQLSSETSIGTVSSKDLQCLSNTRDNIQKQIDALREQQEQILKLLR